MESGYVWQRHKVIRLQAKPNKNVKEREKGEKEKNCLWEAQGGELPETLAGSQGNAKKWKEHSRE